MNDNNEEVKKIAINGLKSLPKPLFSRIDASNKNIEKIGAIFSDPGEMNHTPINRLKKILVNKTFKKILSNNFVIR